MTRSCQELPIDDAGSAGQDRRLRVAHVQLLPILSGVQRVSLDVLTQLDPRRYEPFLICQSPGPLTEAAEAHGIRCLFADRLVQPISPLRDVAALRQLLHMMREHHFDVVHTHSSKTGLLGRIAAKAAGVPTVLHTVHGFAFPTTRSRLKKAVYFAAEWFGGRCCDSMICLKQADVDFARRWLRIPPERLQLIPNGIAVDRYQPLDEATRAKMRRDEYGLKGTTLAVGTVGRLSRQKDPLCFVAAADALLAEGIDARFFLIGDGELRAEVEAEIRRRGRTGQIIVLGWRYDVPQLVGALDLFVLPSRWEGLSLALLEALAAGVPVVATDIPGNREVVVEGVDGLLAPCGDASALAVQMQKLLMHHGLRREYGQAARQVIHREHRLDTRIDSLESLYRSLRHPDTDHVVPVVAGTQQTTAADSLL